MHINVEWYDTFLMALLSIAFVLDAILVRRERVLGWLFMIRSLLLSGVWAFAFLRRVHPHLVSDAFLTFLRISLLVSIVAVISALLRERIEIYYPGKELERDESVDS